jgi:hypothetical protein
MHALTDFYAAAPARAAAATGFQPQSYGGSRGARPARQLTGRWMCATDTGGLTCVWAVDEDGSAGGRAGDRRRAG